MISRQMIDRQIDRQKDRQIKPIGQKMDREVRKLGRYGRRSINRYKKRHEQRYEREKREGGRYGREDGQILRINIFYIPNSRGENTDSSLVTGWCDQDNQF